MIIKFKKLHPDAIIPTYAYASDAGIDFRTVEDFTIKPGEQVLVPTGLAWDSNLQNDTHYLNAGGDLAPVKIYLKLESRSSMMLKGIITDAGVIDSSYRGEIKAALINIGNSILSFKKGDKIVQGIVYMLPCADIIETTELNMDGRGTNGFGSTGV